MLREIEMMGILGRKFGRHHRIDVTTPREAVQANCVRLPGFEEFFKTAHQKGIRFAFFVGKRNISESDIDMNAGSQKITIRPVLEGSKKAGVFQTIIGAIMVVVGVILAVYSGGTLAAFGAGMAKVGAAMMAGGVIQMLSPQPKGLSMANNSAENAPNYAFSGPVNSAAQGYPIGVLYGVREVGGAILSGEITVDDF